MGILIPLAEAVVVLGVLPTPMLDSILRPIQALRTPAVATSPRPRLADAAPAPALVPALAPALAPAAAPQQRRPLPAAPLAAKAGSGTPVTSRGAGKL